MTLQTTITHKLTFAVEAFWDEEGGMGRDEYGTDQSELSEAVRLLELARVAFPKTRWIITCNVETVVKPEKKS